MTSDHKTSVSLLIPCYNAAAYIKPFLEHVAKLKQSFNEVIFYDDASTDNSAGLLTSKGFKVIRGEINKGQGHARNRLAEAASCSYIHFHDIDDELNPAFLQLVNTKIKDINADVVLGNADWIDAKTRQAIIEWRYNEVELVKNPLAYFISNPLGIINTVYKKYFFLKVNGFNEEIKCWEDADLHIRLADAGATFAVIDHVLAYSLRHNNGVSQDQLWCWNCRLKFIKLYLKTYLDKVGPAIFGTELKKIQNAFIMMGQYQHLGDIIVLNKQHSLALKTGRIALIYQLNKILPSAVINKLLKFFIKR